MDRGQEKRECRPTTTLVKTADDASHRRLFFGRMAGADADRRSYHRLDLVTCSTLLNTTGSGAQE